MSIDIRYVVGRIGQAAFVLWASITVAFFVLYALPGNPALLMLGGDSASPPTPEQIAEIERQFGLDKPIFVQYLTFIWNATHGDLGTSFQSRQPVAVELSAAFGPTLQLVLFGSIAAITLGMIIGCLAVYTRTRWIRRVLEAASPIIGALPSFWVALMLMQVLSFQLALLPVAGDIGFRTLIMPGLTLGLGGGAIIAQTISRSLRATVGDHYVEVARAKGASEARVFFRHAFPNAVLPTLTIIGMMIAGMFVYTAVVETVFARRGIGYLLVSAVETKDIPVVLAVVVLAASVFVIFSLFIDLIYPILDPRIGGTRNRRRTGPLGQRSSTTPTGGNAVPPVGGNDG